MKYRFVSYNIQFGTGRDQCLDLDRIADEVKDADVIALQEVDRYWPRSGDLDQVAELVQRLPDYHWTYGAGVDLHRHDATTSDRRQFGNLLLSRTPIIYSRNHLLPKRASTGPISIQRSVLECQLHWADMSLRIFNLHLTHLSAETRLPQVHRLLEIHRDAVYQGTPVCGEVDGTYWHIDQLAQQVTPNAVLLGDFNMQPDSPEYTALTGPISDYGGRIINPEYFDDAWLVSGGDADGGHTSDVQGCPARLDYAFISPSLRPQVVSCNVDTTATGSDHFPLWLELEAG